MVLNQLQRNDTQAYGRKYSQFTIDLLAEFLNYKDWKRVSLLH
jgi:hypothetical protein